MHDYKNIKFCINDDLFYETLLLMIRGETVAYSKRKSRRLKALEKELIVKVENAQTTFFKHKS